MQQVETSEGLWTRGDEPPVSQGTAQLSRRLLQQRYQRQLKARRRIAWLAIWLPTTVAGTLTAAVVVAALAEDHGYSLRKFISAPVQSGLVNAGFGLQQVSLSGHRFTSDNDVFTALDLASARTIFDFDASEARRRIETLPWVEKASISRVFPDALDVRISERQPFAVWRLGSRSAVIDRNGRPIAPVAADAMPGLPRIAGEGAERGAAALQEMLAQYPDLLQRVQLAERHADGRWSLHLKNGFAVHLPLENQGEAIARAAVLVASGLAEKADVDLREGARPLARVRASVGGEQPPKVLPSPGPRRS